MSPYHNEKANSYGFAPLLEDPWIRERLETFVPLDDAVKSDFQTLPIKPAYELRRTHPRVKRIIALDGSVSSTESYTHGFQVGAIKVGMVSEDVQLLNALKKDKFIDPARLEQVYSSEAFTALLPGRGIGHRGAHDRTWQDKFRLELFMAFKHFVIPGTRSTLLTALQSVMAAKTLSCSTCRVTGEEKAPLALPPNKDFVRCPQCGKGVYLTDVLFLDSELTYLDNGGVFLSVMNLVERFMMAGLVEATPPEARATTAFITDGPLAFFSSDAEINNKLLYQIQRQKPQPLLFGLEKTGIANAFAEVPEVREKLTAGSFAMITEGFATSMTGRPSRKDSYAYGKRFLYRNKRGDKIFVVMVPPRVGVPYAKFEARCDDWSTYPTLGSISDILEEQQTDRFGLGTSALGIIARANYAASLPKVLSEMLLVDLVKKAGLR